MTLKLYKMILCLESSYNVSLKQLVFLPSQERRRLAIQNAAQQWEGLKACLELPAQNGSKEDVSPDNSPAHSPAQTNGNAQETSPDEPRWRSSHRECVCVCVSRVWLLWFSVSGAWVRSQSQPEEVTAGYDRPVAQTAPETPGTSALFTDTRHSVTADVWPAFSPVASSVFYLFF